MFCLITDYLVVLFLYLSVYYDAILNGRLLDFLQIPKLKLEMVLPYDFQTAPKKAKSASKASKSKTAAATAPKSNFKKNQISSVPSKPSNKMLNVPKAECTNIIIFISVKLMIIYYYIRINFIISR